MKFTRQISLSLVALLSLSINAADPSRSRSDREQLRDEEARASIVTRILGAGVIVALGTGICRSELLRGSGLDVGLGVSSILGALSLFVDKENARALRRMAINVPVVAAFSAGISSDAVAGKDGFLANNLPAGLGNVIKSAHNNSRDPNTASIRAVNGVATVGGYIALKPWLDKFADLVSDRASRVANYVSGSSR